MELVNDAESGYLCHYTCNKTAYKILQDMTLRFGKVCDSNDPIEMKKFSVNLFYRDINESIKEEIRIENEMGNYLSEILQLLCFSEGTIMNIDGDRDDDGEEINITDDIINDAKLEDFNLRPPYYLPRMWAQYSDKHNGVCLIFKKSKIIDQIEKQVESGYNLRHKEIEYKDFMKNDLLLDQAVTQAYTYVDLNLGSKEFVQKYLSNNVDINYFYKDVDWRDEKEYRFLIWNKPENENYGNKLINIDNESLIGIVFGLNNRDKELMKLARTKGIKNILQLKIDGALFYISEIMNSVGKRM
jgi:hypothetical protein